MNQVNNKEAIDYYNSLQEKIKKITSPLEQFNITTFDYAKTYNDGRYLCVNNQPDFQASYFNQIHSLEEFFTQIVLDTPLGETRMHIWPSLPNDSVMKYIYNYNMWHGVSFLRRTENYIELWSFTANRENHQLIDFYANHLDLLKKFSLYFMKIMENDLLKGEGKNLAQYKNWTEIVDSSSNTALQNRITSFINNLDKELIKHSDLGLFTILSIREKECLKLLIQGKCSKSIARELHISPDTVKTHLTNIKDKTGIRYKSDLINSYQKYLKELGYISFL